MNINKNSFLFDEISSLRGVGKKTKKYLSNKKIEKIKDILWDLPYASIDRSKITSLKELEIDQFSSGSWQFSSDVISSAKDSDAIVLITEWNEYKEINWNKLTLTMRKPAWIFDTRIFFSKEELNCLDINYWQLGTIRD